MTIQRALDRAAYIAFIALILLAPLVLQEFWLNRIAKFLVYGILGVAVSLCWGYGGILNLGQGLFFGAGAYMLAMSLKLVQRHQPAAGVGPAGAGFHAVERRARARPPSFVASTRVRSCGCRFSGNGSASRWVS